MDIDVYDNIVLFFPIRELLGIRLISKDWCESCKMYNRKIISVNPMKCFPRAIHVYVNPRSVYKIVDEEDFDSCVNLKKLTIKNKPIVDINSFKKIPRLQILEIHSDHYHLPKIDTTPMFRHLTHLKSLTLLSNYVLTDNIFDDLQHLEYLSLDFCTKITSMGIRKLKYLKQLEINSIPLITDYR